MIENGTEQTQDRDGITAERGAGLAEYALLLALIAAVALTAVGTVGPAVANLFDLAVAAFPN